MAGLFGFMAAGALQGTGEQIVEQAKAKREAALEELRHGRLLERDRAEMEFRSSERKAGQEFQAGENEKTRAFQTEIGGDLVTLEGGESGVRVGSTVKPLTDPDGKRVKAIGSKTEDPADVKTAEWLVKNGIAKDKAEAWDKVRTAREGRTTPADIEKMVEDAVKTEFGDSLTPPKPDQIEESRKRNRTRILKNLGLEEDGGKQEIQRPAGASDEQIISQAKDAIAKGADKMAVKSRLRQLGIDPATAGL